MSRGKHCEVPTRSGCPAVAVVWVAVVGSGAGCGCCGRVRRRAVGAGPPMMPAVVLWSGPAAGGGGRAAHDAGGGASRVAPSSTPTNLPRPHHPPPCCPVASRRRLAHVSLAEVPLSRWLRCRAAASKPMDGDLVSAGFLGFEARRCAPRASASGVGLSVLATQRAERVARLMSSLAEVRRSGLEAYGW